MIVLISIIIVIFQPVFPGIAFYAVVLGHFACFKENLAACDSSFPQELDVDDGNMSGSWAANGFAKSGPEVAGD